MPELPKLVLLGARAQQKEALAQREEKEKFEHEKNLGLANVFLDDSQSSAERIDLIKLYMNTKTLKKLADDEALKRGDRNTAWHTATASKMTGKSPRTLRHCEKHRLALDE